MERQKAYFDAAQIMIHPNLRESDGKQKVNSVGQINPMKRF